MNKWQVSAIALVILAVFGFFTLIGGEEKNEGFHKLGEKVVRNGIQAEVVGVNAVKTVEGEKAERGSLYFLVHVRAKNIGQTRKLLPSVGVIYKGEELASESPSLWDISLHDEFSSGTRTYQAYDDRVVYPEVGSKGWVVAGLIPKNFDRKDVVVEFTPGHYFDESDLEWKKGVFGTTCWKLGGE